MSFLPVLESILSVAENIANVAQPLEPLIGLIPVAGGPINLILNAMIAAEKLVPATGNGAAKKTAVTTLVNAAAPGIPATTLSTAIDEIVTALNALNAAASKLPATAPATAPA
jgi:hypothetical protein